MKNTFDDPIKQVISERILEVTRALGSNKALANLIGVSQQSITNWIKRGQISVDNAREIQNKLGYKMDWLLGNDIDDNKVMPTSTTLINSANNPELMVQDKQDGNHKHRIDYLDVRAAAGLTGFENSDYPEIVSSLFLSDEGLLQIIGRKSAAGVKIVNVPTDSMEPTIRKSDWVLLDTNIDYYNGDGVYAFAIDGSLFIKRIQKLIGGGYRLHSDNKEYDPQDITDEICQTAKFVGRFIKTIHIDVASL